jgi:fido (protein-threonine AMPylation protein)
VEKNFDYKGLSTEDVIKHVARFISNLWQIHIFGEGNTRTTAVFLIKYLSKLGFNVTNDIFAENSWYFRNALVLASIGEYSEYNYLEEILKDSISFKIGDDELNIKYQTIKGYNLDKYEYNYHSSKKDD